MAISTATVTVTVECCAVVANNDAASVTQPGVAIADVRANDTDCGLPTTLSLASTLPPELTFNTTTGAVAVVSGSAPGVYTFDYTLADANSEDTATATVTYAPCIVVANDDAATLVDPGLAIADVRSNDDTCAPEASTLSLVGTIPPELDFDTSTGAVTLLPSAAAGVYVFVYELATANTSDTATVTITYEPPPPSDCYPPVCSCTVPYCA